MLLLRMVSLLLLASVAVTRAGIPARPSAGCTEVEALSRRGEGLTEKVCSISDAGERIAHLHLNTALKERFKSVLPQAE